MLKNRNIRRIINCIVAIAIVSLMCSGCNSSNENAKYKESLTANPFWSSIIDAGYFDPEEKMYPDDAELIETLFECYSLEELMEKHGDYFEDFSLDDLIELKYSGSWSDFCEDECIPDVPMFIENLQAEDKYTAIDDLRRLLKNNDMDYSDIFGIYVADKNKVLHDTDGKCFESIPSRELITFYPDELRNLKKWVEEGKYSYCPICNND